MKSNVNGREDCRKKGARERHRMLVSCDGKLYFSKETERKLFFFLTLIMLLAGLAGKAGIL